MMPRFVLLRHDCPPHFEKPSHWDFMLEMGGVLRTWELRELPTAWGAVFARLPSAEPCFVKSSLGKDSLSKDSAAVAVTACQLPDHRLVYLDYEGPLTSDRGTVRCCERGTYQLLQASENALAVLLFGVVLQGKTELTRLGQSWQLTPAGDRC